MVNKLPVVGTFWKKIQKHLSGKNFKRSGWNRLINEHIRPGETVPYELLTKFLDDVTTIQRDSDSPFTADVLFQIFVRKYRQKQIRIYKEPSKRGKLYRYIREIEKRGNSPEEET